MKAKGQGTAPWWATIIIGIILALLIWLDQ